MIRRTASRAKSKLKQLATCLMVSLLFSQFSVISAAEEWQARGIVDRYFAALKAGDTGAILGLMAEEEKTRNPFLKDSGYGRWLANRYQDASFSVTEVSNSGEKYAFDIEIHISDNESVSERLVLEPFSVDGVDEVDYRIIKRISL